MKLKLDENIPLSLKGTLTEMGHSVHSVFDESLNGRPDPDLWAACQLEDRFLITQDIGFSNPLNYPIFTSAGVLVLRLKDDSRENLIQKITWAFNTEDIAAWSGQLVVLSDHKLRVRKF